MAFRFDNNDEFENLSSRPPRRSDRRPGSGRKSFSRPFGSSQDRPKKFESRQSSPEARQSRGQKGSWEPVAKWYGKHLQEEDTFQSEVIFPRALHMLNPQKGKSYIDIACGEGAFVRALSKTGAHVVGFDISSTLVKIAEQKKTPNATFRVANATDFARYYSAASFDGASCNLALQNIEDFAAVINDAGKVLRSGAPFVMVLNHPMFRIPRQSGWGWDDRRDLQYRRIDSYMTPNEIPIVAHPGKGARSQVTYSYHRPFEAYVKALANAGFTVDALEEWTSHHTSDSGPRAKAENRARKEIPMFMAIRAVKK